MRGAALTKATRALSKENRMTEGGKTAKQNMKMMDRKLK